MWTADNRPRYNRDATVTVAVAVNDQGRREVGHGDRRVGGRDLLSSWLPRWALRGVKLVISDDR